MKISGGFFRCFWFYSILSCLLAGLMILQSTPHPLFAIDFHSTPEINIPTWIPSDTEEEPAIVSEPQISSDKITPDEDSIISSPSGNISLDIPKGSVDTETNIEFSEYEPEGSSGMQMVNYFELNASAVDSGKSVTSFNKNLTITIKHTAEELAGIDTDSLRLYYLDEKTLQWVPLEDSKFDLETLTLTASTDHFSHYGEQANPEIVGPGKVMAAQVGLQSGTATFNYPLELPSGPGGFKPVLEFNYNSGSIDEMKNKQSVGSWVGIGWSFTLGSISYDSTSKK